jgi:hypothetical protein
MNRCRKHIETCSRIVIIPALMLAMLTSLSPASRAATVKLTEGANISYHDTITAALGAITGTNGATLQAQAGTFREDLLLDGNAPVRLTGGLDSLYSLPVGSTTVEGDLTISSGSLETSNLVLTTHAQTPVHIIFLHHSTGWVIWGGGVENYISDYNSSHGTDYIIEERAYPDGTNYPWANYPYDYWKIWVDATGPTYSEQDTLVTLTADYDVIVFKHCFPVSNIEADTGNPDITSETKSIENYKLQYNALKAKMHQYPSKKFIVWTGAALIESETTPENAERARQFFQWVRESWDEKGDNIFVWDFWTLETEGGLYLKPAYSAGDSHPNDSFAATVAPYFGKRVVDVIEGAGDTGSITGH